MLQLGLAVSTSLGPLHPPARQPRYDVPVPRTSLCPHGPQEALFPPAMARGSERHGRLCTDQRVSG